MGNCGKLLKAINAYLAKADDTLSETLEEVGFVDAEETVKEINSLEEKIADALKKQTWYIQRKLNDVIDLAEYFGDFADTVADDDTDDVLAKIFLDEFQEQMPKLTTAYSYQIDPELTVSAITQRTTSWVHRWSSELGGKMKLTTHNEIERLLTSHLRDGKSVAELTRAFMDSGIRDEYFRARRAALTEMLRAHSVSNQEAMTQNPAVSGKMWRHTGAYKNDPRPNHVDMDGVIVPKSQPFSLTGADGGLYFPMYPRDSNLPPGESINCHCINQPVVDESVLGLSLEERQRLQQEAIDNDDGAWERELDERNKARAGIEITVDKPSEARYNEVYADIQANYNLNLRVDHQNRHIPDSGGYIEDRGILTADPEELLRLYQGNGKLRFSQSGKWVNKEFFTHTEVIGIYKNDTGFSEPTVRGAIHYSKTKGVHIVPARNKEDD